jgi:hypothetical protein
MKSLDEVRKSRQCPKHRMWLKKGNCELCIMEREAQRKEYEKLTGSNKPAIKIKKL